MALFRPHHLVRPTSVAEALDILSKNEGRARLVAGDTTLYDLAQHGGLDGVETLVDVSKLGLDYIQDKETELEIGANTTFSEITSFSLKRQKGLHALFETAKKITPPQIRNMGTIGGSLCTGIPFLDMPTTVLALEGVINAISPRGERQIKAGDLFVDYFQTAIESDEILTSIRFSYSSSQAGSSFIKLGRVTVDFAVVNVASYLVLDNSGKCISARITLGAVANTPIRWRVPEQKIIGQKLEKELIVNIMNQTEVDFEPTQSIGAPSDYKKLVIPKLVRDSLLESLTRAKQIE